MHLLAKRAASLFVAGALVFTGITGMAGCSSQAEPKSAKEIVERYQANEKHSNFHADTNMSMEASMFGQSITVTLEMATDTAGDNSHGTMKMNSFGMEEESEIYIEKTSEGIAQYSSSGTGNDKSWTKSASESASMSDALTAGDILSDGEFKKVDNGYEVTVGGSKLMEAMKAGNMNLDQLFGDMGDAGLTEAIEKSTAVYTFDKDCLLTSVNYDLPYTMSYGDSSSSSSDALTLSADIHIKISMALSNYGGVDASSVKVPDDVKNNALDTDKALEDVTAVLEEVVGESSSDSSASSSSASSSSESSSSASANSAATSSNAA